MQHNRLQGLRTKIVSDTVKLKGMMLNRDVTSGVLKVENVRDMHRSTGRLFQARGPATATERISLSRIRVDRVDTAN